ncbi:MAG: 50S ribosomal protein L18e [archaeon]
MVSKTKIKKAAKRKTNENLRLLILDLKKSDKKIFLKAAQYLARPKRKMIKVNLFKLDKMTKEGNNVLVPGKILAKGDLNHKLVLSAYSFSESARSKLKNSKIVSIQDMKKLNKIKLVI